MITNDYIYVRPISGVQFTWGNKDDVSVSVRVRMRTRNAHKTDTITCVRNWIYYLCGERYIILMSVAVTRE